MKRTDLKPGDVVVHEAHSGDRRRKAVVLATDFDRPGCRQFVAFHTDGHHWDHGYMVDRHGDFIASYGTLTSFIAAMNAEATR